MGGSALMATCLNHPGSFNVCLLCQLQTRVLMEKRSVYRVYPHATQRMRQMRQRKHRSDTVSRRTEGWSSNQLACPPESGRNPHDWSILGVIQCRFDACFALFCSRLDT